MELWIRSQDKTTLIKVNKICFERNIDDEPTIYGYEKYDNYERLVVYKTKERALEILDEIQKLLQPQMILSKVGKPIAETCDGTVYVSPNEYEIKELSCVVYKMPKE